MICCFTAVRRICGTSTSLKNGAGAGVAVGGRERVQCRARSRADGGMPSAGRWGWQTRTAAAAPARLAGCVGALGQLPSSKEATRRGGRGETASPGAAGEGGLGEGKRRTKGRRSRKGKALIWHEVKKERNMEDEEENKCRATNHIIVNVFNEIFCVIGILISNRRRLILNVYRP